MELGCEGESSTRHDFVSATEKAFGMPLNCDLMLGRPWAMETFWSGEGLGLVSDGAGMLAIVEKESFLRDRGRLHSRRSASRTSLSALLGRD